MALATVHGGPTLPSIPRWLTLRPAKLELPGLVKEEELKRCAQQGYRFSLRNLAERPNSPVQRQPFIASVANAVDSATPAQLNTRSVPKRR